MFRQQNLPHFIVVGAMKCATSTLYDQLAAQPEIFLPTIKEPNFFSDDDQYQKGLEWYSSLFDGARKSSILGEASTHYTKLPDFPDTITRMKEVLPNLKIIYVMRDPLERLVSHFMHQWTMNEMELPIGTAIELHAELTNYSLYSLQIRPYIEAFGNESVLPVFFERLTAKPSEELRRVCQFIGCQTTPSWVQEKEIANQSSQRVRRIPGHDLLIESKLATVLRR